MYIKEFSSFTYMNNSFLPTNMSDADSQKKTYKILNKLCVIFELKAEVAVPSKHFSSFKTS